MINMEHFIDENLKELYRITIYNPPVIDNIVKFGLMTKIQVDEFERIKKYEKYGEFHSHKFIYDVLHSRRGAYAILIQILEEHKQADSAQLLRKGLSLSKFLHDLQDPCRSFVGREDTLIDVYEKLIKVNNTTVIVHNISISGSKGIGKTELARKFGQVYQKDFDNNVIWIDAKNEEALTRSFVNLAKDKLNLETKDANGTDKGVNLIVNECYCYFHGVKCLFIFDNVEKSKYLKKFFPRKDNSEMVYVLMTSRDLSWGRSVQVVELSAWKEDEAIQFITKELCMADKYSNKDITELANFLQYFPLRIQEAISYINDKNQMDEYTILNFLKDILDSN